MNSQPANDNKSYRLSDEDQQKVDDYLSAHCESADQDTFGTGASPSPQPLVFSYLDNDQPASPPNGLAARTAEIVFQTETTSISAANQPATGGGQVVNLPFRWSELFAVAAIFMLCATVIWPVLFSSATHSKQTMCLANLAKTGEAISRYAIANNDAMPRANVKPASHWYQIGQKSESGEFLSNSANLFKLVTEDLLPSNVLMCPENPNAKPLSRQDIIRGDWANSSSISYSYQNQFSPTPSIYSASPYMVLIADRNPHFSVDTNGNFTFLNRPRDANSLQHQSRGQNILRGDGSAFWMDTPYLQNGDNIYLAEDVVNYTGNELPSSPNDSFLIP